MNKAMNASVSPQSGEDYNIDSTLRILVKAYLFCEIVFV